MMANVTLPTSFYALVVLRAEELLLRQVVLPRAAVFARLVQSLCRRAEKQVLCRDRRATGAFRKDINRMLEVPESAHRSSLFRLDGDCSRGDRQPVQMYLYLYAQIPKPELRSAMHDCRESDRPEVHCTRTNSMPASTISKDTSPFFRTDV